MLLVLADLDKKVALGAGQVKMVLNYMLLIIVYILKKIG
jgi:hypothetical protein